MSDRRLKHHTSKTELLLPPLPPHQLLPSFGLDGSELPLELQSISNLLLNSTGPAFKIRNMTAPSHNQDSPGSQEPPDISHPSPPSRAVPTAAPGHPCLSSEPSQGDLHLTVPQGLPPDSSSGSPERLHRGEGQELRQQQFNSDWNLALRKLESHFLTTREIKYELVISDMTLLLRSLDVIMLS